MSCDSIISNPVIINELKTIFTGGSGSDSDQEITFNVNDGTADRGNGTARFYYKDITGSTDKLAIVYLQSSQLTGVSSTASLTVNFQTATTYVPVTPTSFVCVLDGNTLGYVTYGGGLFTINFSTPISGNILLNGMSTCYNAILD